MSKYPIDRLLTDADIVVTFNSLSGFEALLRYRPVVTLGPAFYTQPGLVFRVALALSMFGQGSPFFGVVVGPFSIT